MANVLVSEDSLTSIANAIREKNGSTTTYKPAEMADAITAIEGGSSGSGVWDKAVYSTDSAINDTNTGTFYGTQGVSSFTSQCEKVYQYAFYQNSIIKTIDLPKCTDIGQYAFYNCRYVANINLPSCEELGAYSFVSCTSLTNINLPVCKSIPSRGFYSCSALTSASLPACTNIGNYAFGSCPSLTDISLPSCESVGENAFRDCTSLESIKLSSCKIVNQYTFYNCRKLEVINLPSCKTINPGVFTYCIKLTSLDLPVCTYIGGSEFSYCNSLGSIYLRSETMCKAAGALSIPNSVMSNLKIYVPWFLIDLYKADSIWKTYASNFTVIEDLDTTYTVVLPLEGSVAFKYNGVNVGTVSGTECSINVPSGVEIVYKISINGYKGISGTIQSDTDYTVTINSTDLEESQDITIDLSYPFTDEYGILTNLVDGTNFEISESPTPYNPSSTGMTSSIVSVGTGKNNAVHFGYILFRTPSTTDTDKLTVSVTCNAYAESNYDTGVVFIDKSLHKIASRINFSSNASGSDNSTYGHILYNSYGKSTSTYGTYTYTLEADTDYYLHFVYTTDSGGNSYWDRLSITNIKFTTTDEVLFSTTSEENGISLTTFDDIFEVDTDVDGLISTVEEEIRQAQEIGDEEKVKSLTERLEELYTKRDTVDTEERAVVD